MQLNGVTWQKSTRSAAAGHCVEVAAGEPVLVRDSKDPSGPVLSFGHASWADFVAGLRRGEFDRPL